MTAREPKSAAWWREEIEAARRGDTAALGRLFEQSRPYLLLVANALLSADLRAQVDPADLVQNTWLAMQRTVGRFRGQTEEELRAWLRRTLLDNLHEPHRRCHTRKRDVARSVPLAALTPGQAEWLLAANDPPSGAARQREEAERLERALARLPEHYRTVLVLHTCDGLTFAEIGQRLGRSAEAARKLWGSAAARLQKEVGSP